MIQQAVIFDINSFLRINIVPAMEILNVINRVHSKNKKVHTNGNFN